MTVAALGSVITPRRSSVSGVLGGRTTVDWGDDRSDSTYTLSLIQQLLLQLGPPAFVATKNGLLNG